MSRVWILIALLCAVVAAPNAFAQAASGEEGKQVMAAEEARVAALDRSDVTALESILGDDLTYVHASGKVDTKASFLGAIRSGQLHYISWQSKGLHVRVQGDMAIIDGEYWVRVNDSRMQRDPFDVNIFVLTVYAHRDGRWQQVAWQSTRDVALSPLH
jgi:ketosteroid isomerase-like protein